MVSLSKGAPEPSRAVVPVAPPPAPPVQPQVPAGWHPDPHAPHELRYWDGTGWTHHRAPGHAPVPTYHVGVAVTDQHVNGALVAISWIATVVTLGYFLPWAVAETRGKANRLPVFVLTLLLGWTVIGWVVALVLACGSHGVRLARQ